MAREISERLGRTTVRSQLTSKGVDLLYVRSHKPEPSVPHTQGKGGERKPFGACHLVESAEGNSFRGRRLLPREVVGSSEREFCSVDINLSQEKDNASL